MREKGLALSERAQAELKVITDAVKEIMDLSLRAFTEGDEEALTAVEPLEQVIDGLKESLRSQHILRLQQGDCTMEVGFVWADLLTDLERTSDHCSNVAGGVLDLHIHNMNIHENVRAVKADEGAFKEKYLAYRQKYALV